MPAKSWYKRRAVSLILLPPGYACGVLISHFVIGVDPSFAYTAGAIGSTVFNTLLLDKWIWLIHRLGGKPA